MESDPPSRAIDDRQASHDSAMEFYRTNRDRLMRPEAHQLDVCTNDTWMGFSLGFYSGYAFGALSSRFAPIVAVLIASTLAFALGRGCR